MLPTSNFRSVTKIVHKVISSNALLISDPLSKELLIQFAQNSIIGKYEIAKSNAKFLFPDCHLVCKVNSYIEIRTGVTVGEDGEMKERKQ